MGATAKAAASSAGDGPEAWWCRMSLNFWNGIQISAHGINSDATQLKRGWAVSEAPKLLISNTKEEFRVSRKEDVVRVSA